MTAASSTPTRKPMRPMPSRTVWVLEEIRRMILSGELPAGYALVETDLAQNFGVSKTPVREALKILAGRGLVQLGDFKGATVKIVDKEMVANVFGVRLLLEPAAVAATVEAGIDLTPARDLLERARTASSDPKRSDLNREFHRILYASCGNDLLVEILDDLRERTSLITVTLWKSEASWDTEAHEHVALLKAAEAGDSQRAETITRDHIATFASRCAEHFSA